MTRPKRWPGVIIAVLILALIGLGVLARRGSNESPVPLIEVSVVVDDSANARWTRFQAGLEQAAADYDVSLNYAVTPKFTALPDEERTIRSEADGTSAVIVQLIDSSDTVELISTICAERVLGLVDTDAAAEAGDNFASITADNTGIGTALADLLLERFGNKMTGIKIGILTGNQNMSSMQERLAAFTEGMKNSGAEIVWQITASDRIEAWMEEAPADILVALDNDSLESAADAAGGNESAVVYGVGCSDKTIYALDHGMISAMIVPDEFQMGYLALSDVVARVNAPNIPMVHREIPYTVITRTNLYDADNAAFLFPVIN